MSSTAFMRGALLALLIVLAAFLRPVRASAGEITIMAVGDVLPRASWQNFEVPVTSLLKDVTPLFFTADVVVGNLETPLTSRDEPTPSKSPLAIKDKREFVFKAESPDAAQGLRDAGFTVLTLANNHMLDYREGGLMDTVDALSKAGLCTAGGGADAASACRPGVVSVKGRDIAFLAASDVVPKGYWAEAAKPGIASMKDEGAFVRRVEKARADYPDALLVLSLHWGVEATLTPTTRQKTLARKLVDAGADLILGHHPHRLQGVEIYNGRPIFYSLGNFQFDTKKPGDESMIATLTYEDDSRTPSRIRVTPVIIEQGGYPRPLAPDDEGYARILAGLSGMCGRLGCELDGDALVASGPAIEREDTALPEAPDDAEATDMAAPPDDAGTFPAFPG